MISPTLNKKCKVAYQWILDRCNMSPKRDTQTDLIEKELLIQFSDVAAIQGISIARQAHAMM